MSVDLYIVGAGGHGHDVADIAEACGMSWAFLDDNTELLGVVGRPSESAERPVVVAINEPRVRYGLDEGWNVADPLVHPSAVVSRRAVLHPGAVVGPDAVVGPSTTIGPHAHVGAGCTITRTAVAGFSTVGPGVDIAGDCVLEAGVFVGVGATVRNMVWIGEWARVGAGSVVVSDVPAGATVKGVPAK